MNNMGNGIMMGMDGPSVTGTWYNPNTGDSITVRDSYFENGDMKIRTTDGRVLNYSIFEKYIKSDSGDVIKKMPKNQGYTNEDKINDELPPEVSNLLGNLAIDNGPFKTIHNSENWKIIDKVFKKCKSLPNFNILICWDPFPIKEFDTLTEVMDIPLDEITEYCIENYVNSEIIESVKNQIKILIKDKNSKNIDILNYNKNNKEDENTSDNEYILIGAENDISTDVLESMN